MLVIEESGNVLEPAMPRASGMDVLCGPTIVIEFICCTEDLVSLNEPHYGISERVDVECSVKPDSDGHVVVCAVGVELMEEPEAFLRGTQGQSRRDLGVGIRIA